MYCPSEARTHDLPITLSIEITVGRCNQLSHGALKTCHLNHSMASSRWDVLMAKYPIRGSVALSHALAVAIIPSFGPAHTLDTLFALTLSHYHHVGNGPAGKHLPDTHGSNEYQTSSERSANWTLTSGEEARCFDYSLSSHFEKGR